MKRVFGALAGLALGGALLTAGTGVAAASPLRAEGTYPYDAAPVRSTAAAPGKPGPMPSVSSAAAAERPAEPAAAKAYSAKIRSFASGRVLDADTNTLGGNGTKVQLWDDYGDGQVNQWWSFGATTVTGVYKIYNNASGRVLDADTNTLGGNGTFVQLWDDYGNGQLNQFWKLVDTGYHDGRTGNELYKWVNYASGRVLDADTNTLGGNGTKVQLWDDYGPGQGNQDWEF
ncbi:RICIN domain-containing protein [Amycolatopsis sp. NEAU-NG30]|uniref:RICIN domain-containing protein n=1 Tax=Amycolatopsis melonis TaxID=3156488 RepID=A0ABV0L685_9PSEU